MDIGDFVIFTAKEYDGKFLQGMKGKVIEEISSTKVCVEFVKHMGGHTGDGSGKNGHCWCVPKKYLKACTITFM